MCTNGINTGQFEMMIEQIDDPYRRGIIAVHDAEIAAELDWLRSMLGVENESVTE